MSANFFFTPLRKLRQRIRRLFFLWGFGHLIWVSFALLLNLYIIDRLFNPPLFVRLTLEGATLCLWLLRIKKVLWNPLRKPFALKDLSALLERKFPHLEDRLSTSVQLCQKPRDCSIELLEEVGKEAKELLHQLPIHTVTPSKAAWKQAKWGTLSLGVFLSLAFLFPQENSVFWGRLWGQPLSWPGATHLVLLPLRASDGTPLPEIRRIGSEHYECLIPKNTPLDVRILAEGRSPETVWLQSERLQRRFKSFGGRQFQISLPGQTQPMTLSFSGGDDTDGFPKLDLIPGIAPSMQNWSLTLTPPNYTERPKEISNAHEIRVLEGTVIQISFQTDLPVSEVQQQQGDTTQTLNLQGKIFSTTLTVRKDGEVTFHLLGADGFPRSQAGHLQWTVLNDHPPHIFLPWPPRTWRTVKGAVIPLVLHCEDDFGLQSLQLHPLPWDANLLTNQAHQWVPVPASLLSDLPQAQFPAPGVPLEVVATDNRMPKNQSSSQKSPAIQITSKEQMSQLLAEQMQTLREELERIDQALLPFESTTPPPNASVVSRRFLRRTQSLLVHLETSFVELVFATPEEKFLQGKLALQKILLRGTPKKGDITRSMKPEITNSFDEQLHLVLNLARRTAALVDGPATNLVAESRQSKADLNKVAKEFRRQIHGMLDILVAWEDFESAIRLLRTMLDRQRDLHRRTRLEVSP